MPSALSDFGDHLLALAELGPVRTYDDVPIQIGLYPFLKVENGALVVRGSGFNVVPRDDTWPPQILPACRAHQQREGYRWGASAAWDRETPHYMLPADLVIEQPPMGCALYVTGAQMFDFVYATDDLTRTLSSDPHARRSQKMEMSAEPIDDWTPYIKQTIGEIRLSQQLDTPRGVEFRFRQMIDLADVCLPSYYFEATGFWHRMDLVGFAMSWCDPRTSTCFFAQRGLLPEYRRHTRWSYLQTIAIVAKRRGMKWINIGDALGTPGIASFKFSLKPNRLVQYLNVLDRQEMLPHEQPAE